MYFKFSFSFLHTHANEFENLKMLVLEAKKSRDCSEGIYNDI